MLTYGTNRVWPTWVNDFVSAVFTAIGAYIHHRSDLSTKLAHTHAGVMIFVVAEALIPESQSGGNAHQATLGVMLGFTVMMILDVALG